MKSIGLDAVERLACPAAEKPGRPCPTTSSRMVAFSSGLRQLARHRLETQFAIRAEASSEGHAEQQDQIHLQSMWLKRMGQA